MKQQTIVLFFFLWCCLIGTALGQCRDGFPECCASQGQRAGSVSCNTMIPADTATWTSGSSYSLSCQHGDTAAANECTWVTPGGTHCRFTHIREFKAYCDDDSVSFTGDISGNKGRCSIRVASVSKDQTEGRWTCQYQNYKDDIYVYVQKGITTILLLYT